MRSISPTTRSRLIARIGLALYLRYWVGKEPSRKPPRDGRGRFLSKAWLRQAETFTPSDLAWFRSPAREA